MLPAAFLRCTPGCATSVGIALATSYVCYRTSEMSHLQSEIDAFRVFGRSDTTTALSGAELVLVTRSHN